jgi:hypothetical protein
MTGLNRNNNKAARRTQREAPSTAPSLKQQLTLTLHLRRTDVDPRLGNVESGKELSSSRILNSRLIIQQWGAPRLQWHGRPQGPD